MGKIKDTPLLITGFYTATPSLKGYLSLKDIVSLSLSSKQPALRVVVASLQHCLAKARLAVFFRIYKKGII